MTPPGNNLTVTVRGAPHMNVFSTLAKDGSTLAHVQSSIGKVQNVYHLLNM